MSDIVKFMLLILAISMIVFGSYYRNPPNNGDIWVRGSNPFEPHKNDTFLVLDVKDDYVKYKNIKTGYVTSIDIEFFKIGLHKIAK